jgi:hypothetical protein
MRLAELAEQGMLCNNQLLDQIVRDITTTKS